MFTAIRAQFSPGRGPTIRWKSLNEQKIKKSGSQRQELGGFQAGRSGSGNWKINFKLSVVSAAETNMGLVNDQPAVSYQKSAMN